MPPFLKMNRLIWGALPMLAGVALVAYFGFHAAYGDRGLLSIRDLEQEITQQATRLQDLEQQKRKLERRVALVAGPEIDGDLLEEEVRLLLGWTMQDEVVILSPDPRNGGVN